MTWAVVWPSGPWKTDSPAVPSGLPGMICGSFTGSYPLMVWTMNFETTYIVLLAVGLLTALMDGK